MNTLSTNTLSTFASAALLCALLALGGGCASKQTGADTGTEATVSNGLASKTKVSQTSQKGPKDEPLGTFALDGPDLLVVGDLSGIPLHGTLQRKGMVGKGKLKLYSSDETLICESIIKSRPTDKGRVRGLLDCNDGNVVLFTLRNLGPDQGLGIGTSHEGDKDLTIFYHPSAEEAQRRFPRILEEFTALRQEKRS